MKISKLITTLNETPIQKEHTKNRKINPLAQKTIKKTQNQKEVHPLEESELMEITSLFVRAVTGQF